MTARALVLSIPVVMSLALGGCALGDVNPIATPTPTPSASAAPPPEFVPDGTAQDNKAYFDFVLSTVATIDQHQPGKAMVNSLRRAGFSKRQMQVTPDKTRTGLDADSVIVSVKVGRSCLIGQRTTHKECFSSIEPALTTGGCLIGTTRKIDW